MAAFGEIRPVAGALTAEGTGFSESVGEAARSMAPTVAEYFDSAASMAFEYDEE